MTFNRRSFFGLLAGAAAAVTSLSKVLPAAKFLQAVQPLHEVIPFEAGCERMRIAPNGALLTNSSIVFEMGGRYGVT